MMPGGMMPSGWDWGSMWVMMVLPGVAIGAAVIAVVILLLRQDRTRGGAYTPDHSQSPPIVIQSGPIPSSTLGQPRTILLGEVVRSLAPTLMDGERKVMEEIVRAGGEVLQSDLPQMTDFSKATVSKVIHGLEVRGIVVRERHKWTYWCKVNPRLIERAQQVATD